MLAQFGRDVGRQRAARCGRYEVTFVNTINMTVPSVVLVFSGKRKSGKDFITGLLQDRYTIMNVSPNVFALT